FLREAKICASIKHPNLVSVTDFGTSDGFPFLVMDFVDGEDLQHVLEEQGALEPSLALRVVRDIAAALGALHEKGIIHRDLKPANIMIERKTGKVLLTDLGIAKDSSSGANLTQGILGTPAYMAPEQMTDTSKTSPESDIYSLGVVLYAMISGREPFTGENPFAVLQQAREKLFAYGSMAGVAKNRDKTEMNPDIASLLHDMTHYERKRRANQATDVVQRVITILGHLDPTSKEGYQGLTVSQPMPPGALAEAPDTGGPVPQAATGPAPRPDTGAAPQPAAPPPAAAPPEDSRPDTRNVLAALSGVDADEPADAPAGAGGGSKGFVAAALLLVLVGGGVAVGYLGWQKGWFKGLGPDKPDPVKPDPVKPGPDKPDPVKPGPDKPDPVKPQPPKPVFDLAKAPAHFKIALPGAEALEVVLVRPGSFRIGDDNPKHLEISGNKDERPSKVVEITTPFYIGRFEVTVGQYAAYLSNAERARAPEELAEAGLEREGDVYRPLKGREKKPIDWVSHSMARAFCRWVGKLSGLRLDLPGEVEWEYAARGPKSSVYPWGDEWEDIYCCSNRQDEAPVDVGSYPDSKSWCGAEDMSGNVFEWCADEFDGKRYSAMASRDPGVLRPGSSSGLRVFRGGCYASEAYMCRPSYRNGLTGRASKGLLGFRVKVKATPEALEYALKATSGPAN
ncbi:MAG: bifunctional serine/threonine-protein kinase/formylglycine-generating enzyme family protein, partial [Planctomycetota bacterium]